MPQNESVEWDRCQGDQFYGHVKSHFVTSDSHYGDKAKVSDSPARVAW